MAAGPTCRRPRRRSLWWSRSAPSPRRPPTRRPSSSRAQPPFAPSTTTRKSTPLAPIRHPSPRQPVRLRAPHHAPRHHRRPPPYRRARAMFSCAHVRAHHNPEQRRQDHSPGAGPHWPDHQVARLLHHRAGPRRRDRSGIQPELHAGRVPRGRERPRDRRRGHAGEHQVPPASHTRDLLRKEAGTSDIPGEQQGRHHRVQIHAGPAVPPHDIHARVDALPVAAGENSRLLVNVKECHRPSQPGGSIPFHVFLLSPV
ncbi:hypothetical protein VPH35_130673 [Triticum aestivum]